MADVKISQLPAATTPVSGTEELPLVQSGVTKKIALSDLSSISFGATGLTPATATSGAVVVAGTLDVNNGGTGLATLTANNVILGNGTSTPTFVAPSTSGNVLTSNGTTWVSSVPATSGTVTSVNVSGGTTGLTTSGGPITSSGVITLAGTLDVDNGGTGLTAGTSGGVLAYTATGTLASSAALTQYGVVYGGGVGAVPVATAAGTTGQVLTATTSGAPSWASPATSGTVTSVAMTVPSVLSISGSPITSSGTLALTYSGTALPVANGGTGLTAGTSGGVLAYTASGTLASSTALAASALVIGGGAGAAPSTTTTGTGVVTALGVNTGSAGAFVVNGGALGSPSSVGTMPAFTLGGTVSGGGNQINNVVIGTTTPLAGAFTTLSASSTLAVGASVTGALSQFESSSLKQIKITYPSVASYFLNTNASGNLTIDKDGSLLGTFSSAGLAVTGTLSSTLGATIQGLTVGLGGGAVATNTAVGVSALSGTNTAGLNVALGYQALTSSTSGASNTALGYQAGYSASGSSNTFVGDRAGTSVSSGSSNTAVGREAGSANAGATGSNNSSLGYQALYSNTTASNNTAVGYQAGFSITTGFKNAILGSEAGYTISTGAYNTCIGEYAGQAMTTGNNNTFLGQGAGYLVTTGAKNLVLGSFYGNSGGLDIRTASNHIVLSDGDGNLRMVFNGSGLPFIYNMSAGAGTYAMKFNTSTGAVTYDTSSARYKDNIRNSVYGLSHVMQIRSAQFEYKDDGRSDVGFIAEEMVQVIPEVVVIDKQGRPDAVSYDRLTSVLVKAIQELKSEFDAYKATHP